MTMALPTLASVARHAASVLVDAGHDPAAARQDVSVLARHVLRWDMARWLTHQDALAPDDFSAALLAAVERRRSHEPVAYISGEREFYGRPFLVSRAVLIPRPETEDVVDAALEVLQRPELASRPGPARVLDIGTGSGCLAVTIALEAPATEVEATDISRAALEIARENAARLGVAGAVRFHESALTASSSGDFDVIVSNPPYVPVDDRMTLSRDVRDYEPTLALFGGRDGLDVIRALLPEAARALRPGGTLVMEIGQGQADRVETLVRLAGLHWVGARPDLAGIPRVIAARRPLPGT
ncbi:MAG: peptide chain release factor N(5)-glutamine methyltransferase [Acidobacteriota bacterium]